jgi:hypothetical protein
MSNIAKGVNFRLSSLEDLGSPTLAGRVLKAFCDGPSFLVPKKYGREQPLKYLVKSNSHGEMIDMLTSSAELLDRDRTTVTNGLLILEFAPKGEYLVHWRKQIVPSFAGVAGSASWEILNGEPSRFGAFLSLVKEIVEIVNPVYGDVQNMAVPGWDTPTDLQRRLPDVPWVSIYGNPYIQMFGENKILSAPFFKIERLASGHFWLQSTESIQEPVPESVRSAIRNHLGEDAFMRSPRWRYKDGRAPTFDYSNLIHKHS